MAKLIYSAIASLDGYIEDEAGRFDWAEPDVEVFRYVNDLERPIGTFLFGRRMYETMLSWETAPMDESVPAHLREFAQHWRASEKVVYSQTLESASSTKTRIERRFDPEAIRQLKAVADRDLSVGGTNLAGQAISAGLVDEFQLLAVPVVVGGGKAWLPKGVRLDLDLQECRHFEGGVVSMRYRLAR